MSSPISSFSLASSPLTKLHMLEFDALGTNECLRYQLAEKLELDSGGYPSWLYTPNPISHATEINCRDLTSVY